MREIYKYLLCLALPLLCWACTDDIADSAALGILAEGRASVTLNITTPEAFSTRTRAINEANESVLEERFAVFAFDETTDGSAGNLLFAVKTSDVNAESNLNDENAYSSSYGDYTSSPSMAWHSADETSSSGRLYIEYKETAGPLHLLVLANVDIDEVATLLGEATGIDATITTGMTFADVTAALQPALDYDVTDSNLTSIPMAGECELENGITLGATGSVSLRRSVAKFTVRVEYTDGRVESYGNDIENVPFHPQSLQILNVNSYATVYAPYRYNSEGQLLPNISTQTGEVPIPTYNFPNTWVYDEENEVNYQEVVFYVAETENSKNDAGTDNPRISVLVMGTYFDYTDNTNISTNYYRLDLIPESAEDLDDELDYILRNHHYKFVISDATKRGSSSQAEALALSVPDNEPNIGDIGGYVLIEDEDIVSITVETTNDTSTGGETRDSYYVGVSSTSIELDVAQGTAACARVKMVTNSVNEKNEPLWSIDLYSIPYATDETTDEPLTDSDGNYIYAISFVWDDNSSTLWLWLDYPDDVEVGETYAYYIVAGNIRKKMRITIVDSSADDGEGDNTGGGDTEPDNEEPN